MPTLARLPGITLMAWCDGILTRRLGLVITASTACFLTFPPTLSPMSGGRWVSSASGWRGGGGGGGGGGGRGGGAARAAGRGGGGGAPHHGGGKSPRGAFSSWT